MIIQTMTDSEIACQMDMDMCEISQKAEKRLTLIRFRRQIIKATRFPVTAPPFVLTSSRMNRWIVIFRAWSKKEKDYLKIEHATFVCLPTFQEGTHALLYSTPLESEGQDEKIGISIFKPHFFARYKLRHELRETGVDLIAQYFVRNYNLYRNFQEPYANDVPMIGRKIYATSEQGIALGEIKSKTVMLFRTYISYEMMYDDQISEFTRSEILRQQGMREYQLQQAKHQARH